MLLFDEALISPTGLDELRLGALVIDDAVPSSAGFALLQ